MEFDTWFQEEKMRLPEFFMPIVFSLTNNHGQLKVTCEGCHEIVPLDGLLPSHIKGMIEYNGRFIPVIDPAAQCSDNSIELTNDSCILVIEHEYAGLKLYSGIIAGSFEQILELSISSHTGNIKACRTNIDFVLELIEQDSDSHTKRLLGRNHLLLQEVVLTKSRRGIAKESLCEKRSLNRVLTYACQ